MDKIFLNEMEFYGYHGVYPEENKLGQHFYVDLELDVDLKSAGMTDDLSKTVNYGEAFAKVREVMEGPAKKLLETVAEQISERLLADFPLISACVVKIMKPKPPIEGHYRSVGVKIKRFRNEQ
jgi:dihydroneopterin aldolase